MPVLWDDKILQLVVCACSVSADTCNKPDSYIVDENFALGEIEWNRLLQNKRCKVFLSVFWHMKWLWGGKGSNLESVAKIIRSL